jgi:hypothetical protein
MATGHGNMKSEVAGLKETTQYKMEVYLPLQILPLTGGRASISLKLGKHKH